MVEEKSTTESGRDATEKNAAPKIVWDDSGMRSVYANATNVAGGREEIVLLFGMNHAWRGGEKEIKVQLSDRIILSPFAAKRLSILLNNVLRGYESRYGSLDERASQASADTLV